jgi:hypothetical protein
MPKSDYLEKKVLDFVLVGTAFTVSGRYVAIYSAAVTSTGGGAEIAVDRQVATFVAATLGTGVTSNSAEITFPGEDMPAVTVTHVGIWDALTGGNLLYYGPLGQPRSVIAGQPFAFAAGELVVSES